MTLQSGHSVAMQRVVTCEPLLTSHKVTKPQSTRPKLRHGNFSNLLLASKSKSAQGGEREREVEVGRLRMRMGLRKDSFQLPTLSGRWPIIGKLKTEA